MIFYLVDLIINNLNIFVCATILFNIGNYEKQDFLYLLFIDIFINGIPIIFISVLILNVLNKFIRKKFVNSIVLDNLLFLFNYLIFFLVICSYKNSDLNLNGLLSFYVGNFLINYILFLLTDKRLFTKMFLRVGKNKCEGR